MLFSSAIRGIWREDDFIYIRGEYQPIKFHVHEIRSIEIGTWDGKVYPASALPLRRACAIFTLKSGRKRRLACGRLTLRRYRWLLRLVDIDHHPDMKAQQI